MDLTLIDECIEQYRRSNTIPRAYVERLSFYRALWDAACTHAAGTLPEQGYAAPGEAQVAEALEANASIFERYPASLDRMLLINTMAAMAGCVASELRFPLEIRESYARAVNMAPIILSQESMERAGSAPREYLAYVFDTYAQCGETGSMSLVNATLSIALRAQLEPAARQVQQAVRASQAKGAHGTACPVCGSWAQLGIVEEDPESDQRTRRLACTLCGTEWDFEFNRCGHCGSRDERSLQCFSIPDDNAHIVFACDSCSEYVRTRVTAPGERYSIDVEDVIMTRLDDALAQTPGFAAAQAEAAAGNGAS